MSHAQILESMTGLLLGMFVAILSSTVVTNALPKIISELGGGQSAYTWVITASLLTMTASTPLWGKLADLVSKKVLVQTALVIFVVASIGAGLSQSAGMLIAFRALQGIGTGGLTALTQIVMAAMIAPRERGRYSGYVGATFAVATVAGPLIGGTIVDTSWLGWRWCLYVGVPFAIIAFFVVQRTLRLPVLKRKVKVDWAGAFFVAAAVSLLLIWVTFAGDKYDWASWQTAAMTGGAALLALIFVLIESKASEPIIPLRLFRNKTIALTSLASLFVGVGMFAGSIFLSQYFQLARGETPTMSGVLTIPLIAGLAISSTVSGQIISKTGSWKGWLVSGGVLLTAGLGLLSRMRVDTPYWHLAIFMALTGLGIGMMLQNLVLATQNQVTNKDIGVASSTVVFFRSLGGAVGVSALGALLGHRVTGYVADGLAAIGVPAAGASDGGIPDLATLPAPIRTVVQSAYGHGIGDVYLYAAPLALVAFLIVLFIKEVPLRRSTGPEQVAELSSHEAAPATDARQPALVGAGAADGDRSLPLASFASVVSGIEDAPGPVVRGQIRGSEGGGVAHATLTLISLSGQQVSRATARGDGAYSLGTPAAGSYVLIAAADGYQPQASTVVVGAEALAYDVVLAPNGGLAGVVTGAADTLPVEGALIVVADVRGEVQATGKSGPNGAFTFSELPSGDFTVAVNATGYRPTAQLVEVRGVGTTRLEIALHAGAQLEGVTRTAVDHQPLADARVTLVDAAGNVVGTATTGPDGAYAFTDLDAGEYSLIASGYPPVATALTIEGRGASGFDVELGHPDSRA
ncbi:MFS transporter [Pengzhenrongella sp.]|jgi:EmrB/QacA subfamily drug resistance transporter|uniref:MFS transporter n=1 Tax=Pengzhenrongella sp. TaxID=2888820 RepID=UPI002F93DA75